MESRAGVGGAMSARLGSVLGLAAWAVSGCAGVITDTLSPDALVERAVVEAIAVGRHMPQNVRVDVRMMEREAWDGLADGRAFVDVPWADAWHRRAVAVGWLPGDIVQAHDCNEVFFLGYSMRIHAEGEPPPPPIAPEKLEKMEACRVSAAEFTLIATPPLTLPDEGEIAVAVYGTGHARVFSVEARFDEAGNFLRMVVFFDFSQ